VTLSFFAPTVFAVWNGTFYEPGDTLNPECLPTDVDCDVRSPLTSINIDDTIYGASWDTDTTHAPSKNAVYDQIEALIVGGHNPVTIGTANGLSLATQVLSLALASTSTTGALSDTDWDTFNNKQNALGFTAVPDTRTVNGHALSSDVTVTASDVGLGNVTNESKATMFTSPTFTGTVSGFTMGGNLVLGANTLTTSNTGLISNLNADLLDGQEGSYYATASGYVPYTGATADLDLGTHSLTSPLLIGGSAVDSKITYKSTTGAGTASAIAHQWLGGTNGATVIATILNNGNVGIGTTAPTYKLHVAGNAGFVGTTVGNIYVVSAAGYGSTLNLGDINDSDRGNITYTTTDEMTFTANANEIMRITSTGNVGIGTTAPSQLLQVQKDSNASAEIIIKNATAGLLAQASLHIESDAGYTGFFKYSTTRTAYKTAGASDSILYNSAGGNITLLNDNASGNINFTAGGASTAQMTILSGGNVGIGTTAPQGKLNVVMSGGVSGATANSDGSGLVVDSLTANTGISVLSADALQSNYILGSPANALAGLIRWDNTANLMSVGTNDASAGLRLMSGVYSEAVRILSTGNVGIGTTGPTQKLDIQSSTASIGAQIKTTLPGADVYFILDQATGSNRSYISHRDNGTTNFNVGTIVSNSTWSVATGLTTATNLLVVQSGGNVGIGTTAPASKLDILDTTLAGSGSLAGSLLNLAQTWNTTGTPTGLKFTITDTASNAASLAMQILGGAAGTTNLFSVSKGGAIVIASQISSNNNNFSLTTNGLSVYGTNRIGFGAAFTATPLLDVSGTNASGAGVTAIAAKIVPTYNQTSTAGATDLLINRTQTAVGSGAQLLIDAQVGGVSKFSVSNTGVGYFSGNVGIGTTSPAAKLDILDTTLSGSGSLAGSVLNLAQTWNTTGTPTAIKLDVTNTASNSASNLIDLQVGGASMFSVRRSGYITAAGGANILGNITASSGFAITNSNGVFGSGVYNFYKPYMTTTVNSELSSSKSILFNIDADNNDTGTSFVWGHNANGTSATALMTLLDTGELGIGTSSPTSRIHGVTTLSAATGDEVAYRLEYTTNKATSGNDTGLVLNMTDTASPGTSKLLDLTINGTISRFTVHNSGNVFNNGGSFYVNTGQAFDGSAPNESISVQTRGMSTASKWALTLASGTNVQTSGSAGAVRITPTYNQASGDASNTDLLISRTQTAVGSGAQLLIDAQVGGVSKFNVTNAGVVQQAGCTTAGTLSADVSGNIICTPSSERFKNNINDLDNSLSNIMALRPVSYNFNSDMNMGDRTYFGFISEEVALANPEFATHDKDGNPYGLDTNAILAGTVKAIQEMNLNLEDVLSLDVSSPPLEGGVLAESEGGGSFFSRLLSKLTTWLADAGNGIGNIFAGEIETKTLCVSNENGEKTCITKEQLDALLINAGTTGAPITTPPATSPNPPLTGEGDSDSLDGVGEVIPSPPSEGGVPEGEGGSSEPTPSPLPGEGGGEVVNSPLPESPQGEVDNSEPVDNSSTPADATPEEEITPEVAPEPESTPEPIPEPSPEEPTPTP